MAELSAPFPPGEYPVLVVGSGPGALQVSYSLSRLGVDHAVISADPSAGGMFRRWPFFQRLLSWTKPHAPAERGTRAYERYDWNSLLGADPICTAIQPGLMDGTSYFPSRPEMEANLVAFAERGPVAVRYGCRWTGTRRVAGDDGDRFEVETTDGVYRCQVLVVAVGVAEPYTPPGAGMEHSDPLRRRASRGDVRRPPGADHRQAELRLRARHRAAAVGASAGARLAVEGEAVGRDQDAGRRPGTLRPAVRGQRPGRRGEHPRRLDRSDRAGVRWPPDRSPAADRWRSGPVARGRRRDLGDGFRGAAGRPSRDRRPDRRTEPAAGPDAVVGEPERARDLLRRDDQPGRQGPPEARRAVQLRGGPRGALQRPRPGRADRPDAVRHRARASAPGARCDPGLRRGRAGRCARALPPARLPRPRPDRRPGRRDARRRRPAARPRAR